MAMCRYKGVRASFVDKAGTPDCNEFYMVSITLSLPEGLAI